MELPTLKEIKRPPVSGPASGVKFHKLKILPEFPGKLYGWKPGSPQWDSRDSPYCPTGGQRRVALQKVMEEM